MSIRRHPLIVGAVVGILLTAFASAPGLAGIPQPPAHDPLVDGPEDADHQHPDPAVTSLGPARTSSSWGS